MDGWRSRAETLRNGIKPRGQKTTLFQVDEHVETKSSRLDLLFMGFVEYAPFCIAALSRIHLDI